MQLRSLVLSFDDRVIRVLGLLLSDAEVATETCRTVEEAKDRLADGKFDAVFADLNHPEALALIRSVRKFKHNKRSVIFALADPDQGLTVAFNAGAHLVIHTPLSLQGSKRALKAAQGMMLRERRRLFRANIAVSTAIMTPTERGQPACKVLILDLHRNGALVECKKVLTAGQKFQLRFTVPETTADVRVEAVVRWTDIAGRAGLEFESNISGAAHLLQDWAKRISTEVDPDELITAQVAAEPLFERACTVGLR